MKPCYIYLGGCFEVNLLAGTNMQMENGLLENHFPLQTEGFSIFHGDSNKGIWVSDTLTNQKNHTQNLDHHRAAPSQQLWVCAIEISAAEKKD